MSDRTFAKWFWAVIGVGASVYIGWWFIPVVIGVTVASILYFAALLLTIGAFFIFIGWLLRVLRRP